LLPRFAANRTTLYPIPGGAADFCPPVGGALSADNSKKICLWRNNAPLYCKVFSEKDMRKNICQKQL
jgi:hypothetical protein